jgi:cyclic 2,3-diphosphoglycerate synthase
LRAVAVIDGEHYQPVVSATLAELPYEFVAAVLVGGVEKLRGGEEYGVPLVENLNAALAYEPELVVDLSDEPVLPPERRLELASRSLALGLRYLGPDFDFEPPRCEPFGLPSLAVIGTGKRIGKTALTGQLARVLSHDRDIVVVAMGRGGPAEPELIEAAPTLDSLLELSRSGRHAASDHLETAALTGVRTIGCRRCGGGLAGQVASSNVPDGARLAEELAPDLVVFDGSGAAIPPVATDRRILVTSGAQDVRAGLNGYRVLVSDLVVGVGIDDDQVEAIHKLKQLPIIRCELRLEPVEPIEGRVAVFAAGPATTDHLEADVVATSANLADRASLRNDLASVDAETYVIEIKAAAIDVVAEAALERGARVVFARNHVVSLPGEPDLDGELVALADAAVAERVPAPPAASGEDVAGLRPAGAYAGEGRA